MNHHILKSTLAVAAALACTQAVASITLYQGEGFRGRAMTFDRPIDNLERVGANDRASSIIVDRGRWEVCDDAGFRGRCVILRRGNYDSLNTLGLNNSISSLRPVGERVRMEAEVAPPPVAPVYEYRVRPSERIYEAPVTSVRAVVGTPEQRCWVEKEQVGGGRGDPNVGGAIVGGILGGVLGHQVGSGRGNDAATALGAVAGAAVGSQAGRSGSGGYTRDVQRCENVASGPPAYWDVSYNFRGQEHHVQMASQPGPTITVNERGEPRG
jgi:uncharacterized protein YcfJ